MDEKSTPSPTRPSPVSRAMRRLSGVCFVVFLIAAMQAPSRREAASRATLMRVTGVALAACVGLLVGSFLVPRKR